MVFDAVAQDLEQNLILYPYNVTANVKQLADNLLAIIFAVQPFQNDIKMVAYFCMALQNRHDNVFEYSLLDCSNIYMHLMVRKLS